MKKNISINISGIIFHIEEDGYETLRKYLDSINKYFGSFEDSSEILADIESRIAEIFLSRLNEGKQVITTDDVQFLMTTMGGVNDFKAAEEQETASTQSQPNQQKQGSHSNSSQTSDNNSSKKLFRDNNRKILGGICAGLAHYFNVDPVWPRLLFALLVLGSYGGLFLVYIILWIVLPVSSELEDEPSVKKMYRSSDSKVIGGVASGVAAFFGVDVVIIRLLFVITTIFFGTGLVIYIVLWIALPEARTITEKMQMQGEPVTLSNIESTVKKAINEKDQPEESTLTKIILFPFRLIATILNGVIKILGPIFKLSVDVLRVAIGIVISIIGFVMVISLIFSFGMLLGLVHVPPGWWTMHIEGLSLPLESIRQAFPTWTIVFAFLAAFIPALFIMLIGNSITTKRIVFRPLVGWTLFVLFFISVAFLSFTIPQLVYSFKQEGEHKIEVLFPLNGKKALLKLNETGLDDYRVVDLYIKGYEGNNIKLVERFGAQGSTKIVARENAQQVEYNVVQEDSIITFDSNIKFKKDTKFRFQRLDMDLYIPYGVPFVINEDLWAIIENYRNYNSDDAETGTWVVTKEGRLECVSCAAARGEISGLGDTDQFGLSGFNEIDMTGAFEVVIRKGDTFSVRLEGDDDQKKKYSIDLSDETLEIDYKNHRKKFWNQTFRRNELVEIYITLPSLRKLNVTGAGKIKISGFEEEEMEIKLVGAMVGDANISADKLYFDSTGPVVFELEGGGDFMEATVTGPSQFKASNYPVNHGIIETRGLGQARVNVKETLEIDDDFTSKVRYEGNPQVIKRD